MPTTVPASVSVGSAVSRRPSSLGRVELGDAEVENLDPPVARDEQVVGLQVAMDDALVVRGGEPLRDLARVVDGFARRQRAAAAAGCGAIPPSCAKTRPMGYAASR